MKISCIQLNSEFCAPDKNFLRARSLIKEAAKEKSDIIVLPEMWNTGFFPKENLKELADNNGERVLAEIAPLAKEFNVNIVAGSVANAKGDKVYNTAYIFDSKGNSVCEYDKTHLFSPMGEDEFFAKGNRLCRFEILGVKCGVIICYDLRFPEVTRSLAVQGLDFLFVVAQWPKERISQFIALGRARAIENQMFVACANACGSARDTLYGGNSVIFNPLGEELAKAGADEEIITAVCDLNKLSEIRESINVFCDRRTELYKLF